MKALVAGGRVSSNRSGMPSPSLEIIKTVNSRTVSKKRKIAANRMTVKLRMKAFLRWRLFKNSLKLYSIHIKIAALSRIVLMRRMLNCANRLFR